MEICERASGARMHTALYRPFAFDQSALTTQLLFDLTQFLTRCSRSLAGAFLGLLNNRCFKSRLSFVGQITTTRALSYGITGLIGRSGGLFYDLRLQARPGYGLYRYFSFRTFLGRRGDNYDRFLLRVKEVAESFRVLTQVVQVLRAPQPRVRGLASLEVRQQRPLEGSLGVYFDVSLDSTRFDLTLTQLTEVEMFWGRLQSSSLNSSNKPLEGVGLLQLELEPWVSRQKFVSMEALIAHFRGASEG